VSEPWVEWLDMDAREDALCEDLHKQQEFWAQYPNACISRCFLENLEMIIRIYTDEQDGGPEALRDYLCSIDLDEVTLAAQPPQPQQPPPGVTPPPPGTPPGAQPPDVVLPPDIPMARKVEGTSREHWARNVIIGAAESLGLHLNVAQAQAIQAVSRGESAYGRGWKTAEGQNSNNWGAVQAGKPPCNPASSFEYTDSFPNKDGTSTKYQACFKKYATPEEGAAHVVRLLMISRPTTRDAALSGSLHGVSKTMYDTGYYQGFGATPEKRIANHVSALQKNLDAITKALGEPQYLK